MINPEVISFNRNNNTQFLYYLNDSDKIFTQIHTVLDISDSNRPKAIGSFVDEYIAQDLADEHYLKTNHDCIVVKSCLNVSLDETNY